MPADTDHIRRDALHAARSEVRIQLFKYVRRLDAEAKAHIDNVLATAEGVVDGTSIGREAAEIAVRNYLGSGDPREAIEGTTVALDDPSRP